MTRSTESRCSCLFRQRIKTQRPVTSTPREYTFVSYSSHRRVAREKSITPERERKKIDESRVVLAVICVYICLRYRRCVTMKSRVYFRADGCMLIGVISSRHANRASFVHRRLRRAGPFLAATDLTHLLNSDRVCTDDGFSERDTSFNPTDR